MLSEVNSSSRLLLRAVELNEIIALFLLVVNSTCVESARCAVGRAEHAINLDDNAPSGVTLKT